MEKQEEPTSTHDRLPFNIDHLVPPFPTHPHSGLTKVMFALVVGLLLAGLIAAIYVYFAW